MVVGEIEHTRQITSHVLDKKKKGKKEARENANNTGEFRRRCEIFASSFCVGSIDFPGKYSELIMKQIFSNYKIASKRRARLNINKKKGKKREKEGKKEGCLRSFSIREQA